LLIDIDRVAWCVLAAFLMLSAGCGGSKTLPVSGVVTLDGKPLAGAGVLFQPIANGRPASGTTDEDGRFALKTENLSGTMPGSYRVAIAKQDIGPTGDMFSPRRQPAQVKWVTPSKYGVPATSGLEATVGPSEREFTFHLISR
jgi:hypothetical protein